MDPNRSSSTSSSSSSSSSSLSPTSKKLVEEANSEKDVNAQPSLPSASSPNQVIDQPEGYDPNRIPLSIFDRTNAAEWSSASNESLFSIHVGHNSFSVYGDPTKTDEFFKPGEPLAYSPPPMLPPLSTEAAAAPAKPRVSEPKPVEQEPGDRRENGCNLEIPPSPKNPMIHVAKAGHDAELWKSQNPSIQSGRSTNSAQSFSFPILAEGVTSEPAKPDTVEQKIQDGSEAKPNQYRYSWFSCFSWCTWCFPSTRSG